MGDQYQAAAKRKSLGGGALRKKKRRRDAEAETTPAIGSAATASGDEKDAARSTSSKNKETATSEVLENQVPKRPLLPSWVLDRLTHMNLFYPTTIQKLSLPFAVAGRNVIGNAKTGTGKTLCYALPTLIALSRDCFSVFGVVLSPVRELCFQIADVFEAVGKPVNASCLVVVGGRDMHAQVERLTGSLERPHVVVATPGRLADFFLEHADVANAFKRVRVLVVDEADRIFHSNFESELATILSHLPDKEKRQTLLFSATVTENIKELWRNSSRANVNNPYLFLDAIAYDTNRTPNLLEQTYLFFPQQAKFCYLLHLLEHDPSLCNESVIVFCSTIEGCQRVQTALEYGLGFKNTTCLHSLQSQRARLVSLLKFKSACSAREMVDVGATGIKGAGANEDHPGGGKRTGKNQARKPHGNKTTRAGNAGSNGKPGAKKVLHDDTNRSGASDVSSRTILVATDVAARGLDVPSVGVVVNYDLPLDPAEYIHRVGRTARGGNKTGLAISFVCSPQDVEKLHAIEDRVGAKIPAYRGEAGEDGDGESNGGSAAPTTASLSSASIIDDAQTGTKLGLVSHRASRQPLKDETVLKSLGKASKAVQKTNLLLYEIGFQQKLEEHKARKKTARGGGEQL
eukprot:g9151.t1